MHVPVNRVFNNVSRNLGLQTYVNNLDSWSEWAFEAERKIGSYKTFVKKEVTLNDGSIFTFASPLPSALTSSVTIYI